MQGFYLLLQELSCCLFRGAGFEVSFRTGVPVLTTKLAARWTLRRRRHTLRRFARNQTRIPSNGRVYNYQGRLQPQVMRSYGESGRYGAT